MKIAEGSGKAEIMSQKGLNVSHETIPLNSKVLEGTHNIEKNVSVYYCQWNLFSISRECAKLQKFKIMTLNQIKRIFFLFKYL